MKITCSQCNIVVFAEALHCELNKEIEAKLKEVQLHWHKERLNLEQVAQTKMDALNYEVPVL